MELAWLERERPVDVIEALSPWVGDERRARLDHVLGQRLGGLAVVVENLHDPHNGAAAIRSLEAHGVQALHVVEAAEPFRFSPRVTQGCDKWIDVVHHATFADGARALRARGLTLYAAVPGARLALEEIDVSRPTALCFGNEHAGLTPEAIAACDDTFGLGMNGFTESFNLSVSVALAVRDCARRRRAAVGPTDLDEAERLRLRARWLALSLDARAAQGIVERWHEARVAGATVGGK